MTDNARPVIDAQNPWPGLYAFDEVAARFFNGRRLESVTLRRLVMHAPLTVLFGASGLGKTSLLQAGLFPLLREEQLLPVYVRLDFRDNDAPLVDQLRRALLAQIETQGIDAQSLLSDESLWHYLHREDFELWSPLNQLLTPVFVLDQLEELFTLGIDRSDATRNLIVDLADLIENRIPAAFSKALTEGSATSTGLSFDRQPHKVLLSFREDFLPAVEGWKNELPSVLRNRLRLLPMSGKQAFEAVYNTAPHLVDESLAWQIVHFVAGAQEDNVGFQTGRDPVGEVTVEPALLSLLCRGLNERRKEQSKEKLDSGLLANTGRSIIADYYEEAVEPLPERVQRFIENELITERGFRKPCDADDARQVHGVSNDDIRRLVNKRLLRVEPQRGTERIELTHDLLTAVVRDHRDRRREKERVRQQQREHAQRLQSIVVTAIVVLLTILSASGVLVALFLERARRVEHAESTRLNKENSRSKELTKAATIRQEGFRTLREGSYVKAIVLFTSALSRYQQFGDRKNEISTMLEIGDAYRLSRQYGDSEAWYRKSLDLSRLARDRAMEGATIEALASLKEETGDLSHALANYELAQQAYEDAGDAQATARLMERRGVACEDSKDLAEAVKLYEGALKDYTVTGDLQGKIRVTAALNRVRGSWGYLVDLLQPHLYMLKGETVNVGRNAEGVTNDISFSNQLVSRRHLALNREGRVDDFRSRNGTSINARVLPYGVGARLTDRDILVLANVQPLQFFATQPPSLPTVPSGSWAVFIDGQDRSYSYLTRPEHSLSIENGHLNLHIGTSDSDVFRLRVSDRQYQMYLSASPWRVFTIPKKNDYEYGTYAPDSGEWFEWVDLPFTFVQLTPDQKNIEVRGPAFQVVLFNQPAQPAGTENKHNGK
jgi:tetratricopeptide (TPR) repeat protein